MAFLKLKWITVAFILVCMALLLKSCVKPYGFEIQKNKEYLVVYGEITNQPEEMHIAIKTAGNYTNNTKEGRSNPILGARVYVEENEGRIFEFEDKNNKGIYTLTDTSLIGKPGRTYVLHIKTKEGKHYRSKPETMPAHVGFESVHDQLIEKEQVDNNGSLIKVSGYQIFVNLKDPPDEENFYLWRWSGVFKIVTVKDIGSNPPAVCNKICYRNEDDKKEFVVLSDREMNGANLVEPLTFIERSGYRFTGSPFYVFTLEQYSISSDSYDFWKGVKEQIGSGSFSDVVPGPIVGNIYNEEDENEEVLGQFSAVTKTVRNYLIQGKQRPLIVDTFCFDLDNIVCDKPESWPDDI